MAGREKGAEEIQRKIGGSTMDNKLSDESVESMPPAQ